MCLSLFAALEVRISRAPCHRWTRCLAALALALGAIPALAAGVFVVNYPWARPAAKGAATEVFMELTAVDGGALVGARSAIAGNTTLVGPGKSTAPVERVALSAGAPVMLMPGSYRVRLSGLARPLKLGDHVPLVLIVEQADGKRVEVGTDAEVRRQSTVDDHLYGHRH
jgi:periplasmic copper chaperone A